MSLTIADETLLELVRGEVARQVAELRPLIREELIEQLKWVTEESGVELLEIEGKDPQRTFRRLMNTYGVEQLKLGGLVRYRWKKRQGENVQRSTSNAQRPTAGMSIEELIEAHVVKPAAKKTLPQQQLQLVEAAA